MPEPITTPIFTANDFRTVKELQRRIVDLRALLEKSGRCGVNCETELTAIAAMSQFLSTLELEFMTPPPPGSVDPD